VTYTIANSLFWSFDATQPLFGLVGEGGMVLPAGANGKTRLLALRPEALDFETRVAHDMQRAGRQPGTQKCMERWQWTVRHPASSMSFLSFFLALYSGIFGWAEGRVGGRPPTPPLPLRSASCGELLRMQTRHKGLHASYYKPTVLPQVRALALSEAASRPATPNGHHH
jgi:hypothetical protein